MELSGTVNKMAGVSASQALTRLATIASADVGRNGQELCGKLLFLRDSTCEFRRGCWAVSVDADNPSISSLLHSLRLVEPDNRFIQHLFIRQSFGTGASRDEGDLVRLASMEETSNVELGTLMTLLSSHLRTFTLVHASTGPTPFGLASKNLLEGLRFPLLQELVVHGPPATTERFALPLQHTFAPSLRRLELPSDMLRYLGDAAHVTFPRLRHLVVHPLRLDYTVDDLDALFRIGGQLGILTAEPSQDNPHYVQPGCDWEQSIEVIAYYDPASAQHSLMLGKFQWDVVGRVKPGMRDCVAFTSRELVEGEVPFEALAGEAKRGWLSRRLQLLVDA